MGESYETTKKQENYFFKIFAPHNMYDIDCFISCIRQ